MRRLSMVLGAIFVCGAAWAQPPETPKRVSPQGHISVAVGQTKIFNFEVGFGTINVVSKGVAEANARTDHQMTITGVAEGETALFVYDRGDKEIYAATVTVTTEPGHVVRFYDGKSKDYIGFYCTEFACGRADKELNGARDVSSITTVSPGGTAITRTFGGAH